MVRIKRGTNKKRRHKKILEAAKGYQGRSSTCYRVAKSRVEKGWQYAYRDRRNKKRVYRSLWIQRINAAVKSFGINYSKFMNHLKTAGIELNRKVLSELAIMNPDHFADLVKKVVPAQNAS
ncbi:50S ribosomal protein L20 [Candidatus Cytomitobacter primus]|uniref:Large ribosomal subunit protein bL20 n=1 Tax=Candidatus Cytomitobacter primus TaxID=2066024 RepID=A0A5C0UFT5_9PROT|nr:50S ribosomal protein L20 [Candidatus Cytomitobacter primus]QEK38541.1 50S ribosomal protein L20 [Candidatus Cytomitobacter primus]